MRSLKKRKRKFHIKLGLAASENQIWVLSFSAVLLNISERFLVDSLSSVSAGSVTFVFWMHKQKLLPQLTCKCNF